MKPTSADPWAVSTRSFLLWLALVLLVAGVWVPVRDTHSISPASVDTWALQVTPGVVLVILAPLWAWRGGRRGLWGVIHLIGLGWMCWLLIDSPASCLGRHAIWISSSTCATMAFWIPPIGRRHGAAFELRPIAHRT